MSTDFQGDVQSGQGRSRWPLFAFALLFVLLATVVSAPASPGAPSHLKVAKASQAGKSLILQVRTDQQVALHKLHGFPTVCLLYTSPLQGLSRLPRLEGSTGETAGGSEQTSSPQHMGRSETLCEVPGQRRKKPEEIRDKGA